MSEINKSEDQQSIGNSQIEKEEAVQKKIARLEKKDKLTISISSAALLFSGLNFGVSFITNERDAYYRELSIKPNLQMMTATGDLKIGIANQGLGGAEIKRITLRDNEGCLDSNDARNYGSYYSRYFREIQNNADSKIREAIKGRDGYYLDITANINARNISTGNIIAPNSQHVVYDLRYDIFLVGEQKTSVDYDESEANKTPTVENSGQSLALERFDPFEKWRWNRGEFFNNIGIEIAKSRSIVVEYCSLSGKYCSKLWVGQNKHFCGE